MTDRDSGARWFLAQHKPNSHRVAKRNLERQGFSTFLPVQEETRRTRGRFVTHLRPLFPGYIFVAFDPAGGNWRAINSTVGITRLIGAGNAPRIVPGELVDQLKARCDAEGKLLESQALAPGDRVTLATGPFADYVATVESLAPDRRVWLLLDLMGQQTRVAMDVAELRGARPEGAG
ncbi:transcription termination/antitermination protein NusG [Sediminimonas sp.]|uniref:transcription termination/antitermination protein NusG n=1 Tax=Sediminimonas sp. TaxID=2823379 RepID=UPI0025DC158D|nr:transcriptional activator RfaH [Sediminimonas sp.]